MRAVSKIRGGAVGLRDYCSCLSFGIDSAKIVGYDEYSRPSKLRQGGGLDIRSRAYAERSGDEPADRRVNSKHRTSAAASLRMIVFFVPPCNLTSKQHLRDDLTIFQRLISDKTDNDDLWDQTDFSFNDLN